MNTVVYVNGYTFYVVKTKNDMEHSIAILLVEDHPDEAQRVISSFKKNNLDIKLLRLVFLPPPGKKVTPVHFDSFARAELGLNWILLNESLISQR